MSVMPVMLGSRDSPPLPLRERVGVRGRATLPLNQIECQSETLARPLIRPLRGHLLPQGEKGGLPP
jgi:hypothetical protein